MGRLRLQFRTRIRWKILGPYLVLALSLAALATYLVTRVVSGSLEERFTNQLAEAARVAGDTVVRQERDHLEVIRTITFTDGITEAVIDDDQAAAEDIALPIAANSDVQQLMILDGGGNLVYAVHQDATGDLGYATTDPAFALETIAPVSSLALAGALDDRGDKFAAIVTPDDGTPRLVSAGPIYDGERVIGAVAVASSLHDLAAAIKQQALANVTIYSSDGYPLASTFITDHENPLHVAPSGAATPERSGIRNSYTLNGRTYQFLYTPLYVRGESIGAVSVALPTAFVTSAGQTTREQMALLFGTATLVVLAIGLMLSRVITAPIHRLVRAAAAVSAGDLTARSGVSGRDEIGALAGTFDSMTEQLQRQHLGTIRALVSAIDARDPYTRGHSVRVGHLSVEIGTGFGLSESQLQHLQVGGYLHDIGKIGVRDAVLLKPGALTPEERSLIEEHPRVGLEILESVVLPQEVRAVVGQHHERLDGTGYPFSLSAEELTIFPRIAAVSDVYDALTTDRPYRAGLSVNDALKILFREAEDGLLDQDAVAVMARVAWIWEQRVHDDPRLQGQGATSRLHIPDGVAIAPLGDATPHDHPHPHTHPGSPGNVA